MCWIPIAAVKELERVCKSGGKIIIPTYINASEGVNSKAVRLLEIAGANLNGSLIFILIKNSLKKPGIKMFVFL